MNLKIHLPQIAAAGIVALAAGHHATAAVVTAPVAGDLFLGFRAAGDQGASVSYIVNLGQYTTFRDAAPGSSFELSSLTGIGADLASAYGGGWATRTDLTWGIFGVSNGANPVVFASREFDPTTGAPSLNPYPLLDLTSRSGTATQISSVLQGSSGYQGRDATVNNTAGVLQTNFNGQASYAFQVGTTGTTDFGSLSQWNSIEGDFGGGVAGTALDLYRIAGSGVTTPGYFTISNTGVVSFNAVPEPSAALLGALASVFGLTVRRRKSTSA